MTALMPVALVFAHRSSPLVLSLAAGATLAAAACDGTWRELAADLFRPLAYPLGIASLAFLAWAAVSITWSPDPRASVRAFAEFAGSVAIAFLIATALPARMPASARRLFWAAISLAALLIVADLWSGLALRRALGARVAYFVYNRPVLTLMALGVPAMAMLRHAALAAALTLACVGLAIARAESGAAVLGAAVATVAFAAARSLPRKLVIGAAALGLAAALALAPLAGDILAGTMPAALHDRLRGTSSRARVDIARSFGAVVRRSPWAGAGFGASAEMADTDAAAAVAPELRPLLGVGHPHNAALQIWVELGAVGAALATIVVLLLLRLMAGLRRDLLAPRLALLMGAAAVSLVGQGAWQGWWPAALGAAILWLRFTDRFGGESPA